VNAEVIQLPAWQAHKSGLKIGPMPKIRSSPAAPSTTATTLRETDESLMYRVGAGEDAALAELIDRWKNPLVNFFYRSLQSLEQAEDLAQMVYIRLYWAAPKYQASRKPPPPGEAKTGSVTQAAKKAATAASKALPPASRADKAARAVWALPAATIPFRPPGIDLGKIEQTKKKDI